MIAWSLREQRKRLRYAAAFVRKRLVHTNLQLLYDCDFSCQICDFWKKKYKPFPRMSVDQVAIVSEKLNRIAPQIVSIGGGEPLLHPDIEGVIRSLARYHFPVMICNGWHMTADKARALFGAGIYEVSISVDYADPAKHDAQRGAVGAYDKAIAALRLLSENRVHPWQRVHMIAVVMDDNLDELEPLMQLCRRMGITFLLTLYSDSRGAKEVKHVDPLVSERLLALKRAHPEFVALRGYVGAFSEAIRQGGIGPCSAGRNLCNIDSQGNVALCIDRVDEVIGNILSEDARVIEDKLLQAHLGNTCRDCWTSCRGTIETLMSGKDMAGNMLDYYRMTRDVRLTSGKSASA